jgi:hypothetical protein
MAMQELNLNLAGRNLIHQLISRLDNVGVDEARTAKSIRKTLELKVAVKETEKLEDDRRKEMEKPGNQELKPYGWEELNLTKPKKFTIDDAYVTWLKEKLQAMDWTKVNVQGQMMTVTVSLDQMESIADLADALLDAKISGKEEKE